MTRWYVYLVRCRSGSLYTGITTDVSRRFAEHQKNTRKAAKSLRGKVPLKLVLRKKVGSKGLALKVEDQIKKLPKMRKEQLIENIDLIEKILKRVKQNYP